MVRKIIYQKKYQNQVPFNDYQGDSETKNNSSSFKSFWDTGNRRKVNTVRKMFRTIKVKRFINCAIQAAELYQLDILITQHSGNTTVELSFDSSGFLIQLKKLISMADQMAISAGIHEREITILLNLDS